ncbi:MAG: type IV secretory system conjugative DNA transfer family protein [Eubacterium sp.]|nr:type IV secretory system conjugative DNA transfer family protein [Eubacterium sp.]
MKKIVHSRKYPRAGPARRRKRKGRQLGAGRLMKERGKKLLTKITGLAREKWSRLDVKKLLLSNLPYLAVFYAVDKCSWLYGYCAGKTALEKLITMVMYLELAFKSPWLSLKIKDILTGIAGAALVKGFLYYRRKQAKKFRPGQEYGSARWGTPKDIEPFIDPVFENNIILTQTERLTMSSRPKLPKNARNKNVIVIGGSGSGKTRFYVKPNLMQMPRKVSYVVTDPNC